MKMIDMLVHNNYDAMAELAELRMNAARYLRLRAQMDRRCPDATVALRTETEGNAAHWLSLRSPTELDRAVDALPDSAPTFTPE